MSIFQPERDSCEVSNNNFLIFEIGTVICFLVQSNNKRTKTHLLLVMAPPFPFPFYSSLIHIQVYSSCVLMNDYKLYPVIWPYQFVWLKKLSGTAQWHLSDASGTLHATQRSPPRAKVLIAADKAKTQSATHPTEWGEIEQAVYSLKFNLS